MLKFARGRFIDFIVSACLSISSFQPVRPKLQITDRSQTHCTAIASSPILFDKSHLFFSPDVLYTAYTERRVGSHIFFFTKIAGITSTRTFNIVFFFNLSFLQCQTWGLAADNKACACALAFHPASKHPSQHILTPKIAYLSQETLRAVLAKI
jgi:hypothetical protein